MMAFMVMIISMKCFFALANQITVIVKIYFFQILGRSKKCSKNISILIENKF